MADQTRVYKVKFEADNGDFKGAIDDYLAGLNRMEKASAIVSQQVTKDGKTFVEVTINSTRAVAELQAQLQRLSVTNQLLESANRTGTTATAKIESEIAATKRLTAEKAKEAKVIEEKVAKTASAWQETIAQQNAMLAQVKFAEEQRVLGAGNTANRIKAIERQAAVDIENIRANLALRLTAYEDRIRANPGQVGLVTRNANQIIGTAGGAIDQVRQQAAMNAAMEAAYAEHYERNLTALSNYVNQRGRIARTAQQEEAILATYGATSRQAMEFRLNQARLQEEERLTERLAAIRRRLAEGTISLESSQARVNRVYTQHGENLRNITEQETQHITRLRQTETHHRGLIETVTQYGIAWRITNGIISAAINAIKSIPNAGIEMQSTVSTLHASFSNTPTGTNTKQGEELTAIAMKQMQQEAVRTGIALTTLETNYRTFLASAKMAGESTSTVNKIFSNLNTVITALHMSGDRAQLTFLALSQMFNKGKVQSEELTKQLGNLLPGAFAAFAQATGRTTQQLVADMKAGTVAAHENIAKFIEFYARQYGDAFTKATTGLNAELGRLNSAWTNLARSIFGGTGEMMADTVRGLTSLIEKLTIAEHELENFRDIIKSIGIAFATIGIAAFAFNLGVITAKVVGIVAAFTPWGRAIAAIGLGLSGLIILYDKIIDKQKEIASPDVSNEGKLVMYEEQIASTTKKLQELEAAQANIAKTRAFEMGWDKGNTREIALTKMELERLAEKYSNVGAKQQELHALSEITSQDFDKIADASQKITEYLEPEIASYNKKIAALEELIALQNKVDMAFIPVPMQGATGVMAEKQEVISPSQINAWIAKATSEKEKALGKQTEKDAKEQNKLIVDAYNDSYKQRENDLKNHLANMESLLSAQKDTNDFLLKSLDYSLKAGNISLKEYYDQKEALVKASMDNELAVVNEQIKAVQEARAKGEAVLSAMPASVTAEPIKIKVDVQKSVIRSDIEEAITAASVKYKVDSSLIRAMIKQESAGKSNAVSNKGAGGLMQLMPDTFTGLGYDKKDFFDIATNIDAGTKYIKQQLDKFQRVDLALAAYNAGPGAVLKYGRAIPPYKETQNYVARITGNLGKVGTFTGSSAAGTEVAGVNLSDQRAKQEQFNAEMLNKEADLQAKKLKLQHEGQLHSSQLEVDYLEGRKKLLAEFATPDQKYDESLKLVKEQAAAYLTEAEAVEFVAKAQEKLNTVRVKANQEIKDSIGNTAAYNNIVKQMQRRIASAGLGDKASWLADQADLLSVDKLGNKVAVTKEQMQELSRLWETLNKATQNADLLRTLKDGFVSGFQEILAGTKSFGESFKSIFDNAINQILNNSLRNLITGIQDAFDGFKNGGSWAGIGASLLQVGAVALTSWLSKDNKAGAPSVATTTSKAYGSGAMAIADTAGRDLYSVSTLESVRQWNFAVNTLTTAIRDNAIDIAKAGSEYISLGLKTFAPSLSKGFTEFTGIVSNAFTSVKDFGTKLIGGISGLFSTASTTLSSAVSASWTEGVKGLQTTFAGSAQAIDAATKEVTTSIGDIAGGALSVLKLGYDLFSIASNEALPVIDQVSSSFSAAAGAAAGLASFLPALGPIGAALEVLSLGIDVISKGFTATNVGGMTGAAIGAFFGPIGLVFGSMFGKLIGSLFEKAPVAQMLFGNSNKTADTRFNARDVTDTNGDYFVGSSKRSADVGVDTAFGWLVMRASGATIATINDMFLPLLRTTKAYDEALATSIGVVDREFGQAGLTMTKFNLLMPKQFESEQKLKNLDTSSFLTERFGKIGDILGQTGTIAGQTASVWMKAFSDKLFKPGSENKAYNTTTLFNIEAFIAGYLPQLSKMPLKLAELFVKSVKSVADGATQKEFEAQMNDFFSGWSAASEGMKQAGIAIGATQVEEYLSSLVGLGLSVKDAGNTLYGYARVFSKYGQDATTEFNKAFDGLLRVARDKGYGKDQFAGYMSTTVAFTGIAADTGVRVTSQQLDTFAVSLNDLAIKTTQTANDVIDHAIASEKLGKMSREAAITQLLVAGKIDDTTIASASFGKALTELQQKVISGVDFANTMAMRFGSTLGNMGASFEFLTGIGDGLTRVFGDIGKASEFVDTTMKSVLSPETYAAVNQNVAQQQFNSAADTMGLNGLKIEDFKLMAVTRDNWANLLAMIASTDPVLNQQAQGWVNLINAGNNLISTTTAATSAIEKLDISTQALANYGKEFGKIGKSNIQNGIEEVYAWRDEMIAASAEIATKVGFSQEKVLEYIQTIASSRYTQAIQSAIDTLKNFGTSVSDWVAGMKATKIGTPGEQFAAAQANAIDIYTKALSGDTNALGKVTSAADSYISAIESRFGSSDYAMELKKGVVDAVSGLPGQLTLQDIVQSTSDEQVTAIYSLPTNIADAIIARGLVVAPTNPGRVNLANDVITTAGGAGAPGSSADAKAATATADVVRKLEEATAELRAFRKDQRQATEAIISGNFIANGAAADGFTTAVREQTSKLIYNDNIKVGLA